MMWIDGELPFADQIYPFIPIAAEDEGANVLCSHDSDVGKATQTPLHRHHHGHGLGEEYQLHGSSLPSICPFNLGVCSISKAVSYLKVMFYLQR